MHRRNLLGVTAAIALATTSACGGSSGGSGSTPAPTPAPAPAPSPAPAPAPSARVFGASAVACFVVFFTDATRSAGTGDAGYCSRDGRFGAGVTAIRPGVSGAGIASYAQNYVTVAGIESAGSTGVVYTGPRGSRVYSPLTTLIDTAGSQAAVQRALGLDSGPFALAMERDLTLFDPADALASSDAGVRQDGARVAAANLRATAVVAAIGTVINGNAPSPYGILSIPYLRVGPIITADSTFLFDDTRMTQILLSVAPSARYRSDVLSAAAHLIDTYAAAIGAQVADTSSAAQFTLGIKGYLEPELAALLQANTAQAASAAQATTTTTIRDRTAIFRDIIPFPASGLLFPGPDFFVGTSGAPISIGAGSTGGQPSILGNDIYATETAGLSTLGGATASVTVPTAKSGEITASLSGETITVNAVGGFVGTSYFDYRVRHTSGEEGTARIYVLFR